MGTHKKVTEAPRTCFFCNGPVRAKIELTYGTAENPAFWMRIACTKCGYQTRYEPGNRSNLSEIPLWMRGIVKWASIRPWARCKRAVGALKFCGVNARADAKLVWPWWPIPVRKKAVAGVVADVWPVVKNGELRWRRSDRGEKEKNPNRSNRKYSSVDYLTFEDAMASPLSAHRALVRTIRHPPSFKTMRT